MGLAYETSTTSNTITNCVASGYTVRYKLLSEASLKELNYDLTSGNSSDPLGIAIGGLVGFSMSDMSNCAASNRVVMDMEANYVYDGQGTVFIGGFAGSYFYGKMTDCYSGGTVEFEDNNADDSTFAYGIARLRASNFCPGWMDTPASGKSYSSGTVFYERIYSTTELSDVVWTIREKENNSGKYFTAPLSIIHFLSGARWLPF